MQLSRSEKEFHLGDSLAKIAALFCAKRMDKTPQNMSQTLNFYYYLLRG